MSAPSSQSRYGGSFRRGFQMFSPSTCCHRGSTLSVSSNILMVLTMRVLVVMALCLCFAAPSPVLSITLPEDGFRAEQQQMTGVSREDAVEDKNFHTIAKSLLRTVLGEADEGELVEGKDTDNLGEMTFAKRAGSSRPERELRRSYPLGRRNPVTSRSNQLTSRSKFTFGKRGGSPLQDTRSTMKQLLEELEKDALQRNMEEQNVYGEELFNIPGDNHQVQKDAMSAFPFGKRALPAFSFGKRGMPGFSFGRRRMPSFAFGKRGRNGPAFAFGRRDWEQTGQELNAPEMGPYEIKRNIAFSFGKRDTQ